MTKEETWLSGDPDFDPETDARLLPAGERLAGESDAPVPGAGPVEASAAPASRRKERSGLVEALILVLIALVLALSLKTYVAEAYEIKGRSMQATFEDGEKVVVLKTLYEIARGDIVVFASKEEPGKDLIKRVIGLPGERVKVEGGHVSINGRVLDEPYAKFGDSGEYSARVEPDHYYVLGDNRPDSHDSRKFDTIPAASIKGKVVVRWWPLTKLQSF
jgi:signal peptidase I